MEYADKYRQTKEIVNEIVLRKLDSLMLAERLFLDSGITMASTARAVSTNRTYFSRAVCSRHRNFKEYVNNLRVDSLLEDISSHIYCGFMEDIDDFAARYGFKSRRSMDRALQRRTGMTYNMLVKRKSKEESSL